MRNNFYILQVLANGKKSKYYTWTRWGRIGNAGKSTVTGNGTLQDALSIFGRKFKEQTGLPWTDRLNHPCEDKYIFVEKQYLAESDEDIQASAKVSLRAQSEQPREQLASQLPEAVQRLIRIIFSPAYLEKAMAPKACNLKNLPFGKLSRRQLMLGVACLRRLEDLVSGAADKKKGDDGYFQELKDVSDRYFSTIPRASSM